MNSFKNRGKITITAMTLHQLRDLYEKRRLNLVELLEKNPKLDAARQHQIYGAICEIDILLRTVDHLREKEVEDNMKIDRKTGRRF